MSNTNQWSLEQKLTALMRMPWTVRVESDPADGTLVAHVSEIPDAIATGQTERELHRELWESLSESLRVRLEFGDSIDLPKGAVVPWAHGVAASAEPVRYAAAVRVVGGPAWLPPKPKTEVSAAEGTFRAPAAA